MIEKFVGKPPADMDKKMWTFHWLNAGAAVGAIFVIIAWFYIMWEIAVDMQPGMLN